MKTGIFGGAFNPVHKGHMNIAKSVFKSLNLDRIIFVPTAEPPHRSAQGLLPQNHRVNMLNLAIADTGESACFSVSNVEFALSGKSYTYNTLLYFKEIYPHDEFYLIIGADQYFNFSSWYNFEEIINLATVVSAAREKGEYEEMIRFRSSNDFMKNTVVLDAESVSVSSSEVRAAVKNGGSIERFVTASVAQYIKKNNLYI